MQCIWSGEIDYINPGRLPSLRKVTEQWNHFGQLGKDVRLEANFS